ncbi:LRP chaperone MESD isoform X2 [Panthera uncia]|uniref:LRP chaperone MESD isoform X2 n=1 Tax=Panthera uncia TaxID=29064 RepID=UPI0020FFCF31|nr:LRP chaperone MESD isoform X2 [Panthera uncia]
MAASGWVRAALVLLCASDLLLPPRACAAEGAAGTSGEASPPPRKKKKDIRDYNDADMARLLEQWEKDDDIEEGDLPEHKRPSAPIDFSQIDPGRPESILKMTRKGKTLMMFVTVSGNPTEKETEEITSLWQGSLFNANYDVQRQNVSRGGTEGEGDTEPEAGSRVRAVSTEPDAGPEPTNREIVTWAEVGRSTYGSTQDQLHQLLWAPRRAGQEGSGYVVQRTSPNVTFRTIHFSNDDFPKCIHNK